MSDAYEQPLQSKVRLVMEAMGRSLAIYQQIELLLKLLLPHLVGPHQDAGDIFADWKSLLNSKTTLGPLVACLDKSVLSTDPKGFSHYLTEVVKNRNELVHHFYELPFSRLSNIQECDDALVYLDVRFRLALTLHQVTREIEGLSLALEKSIVEDGATDSH
jgi:hypothetical protein